MDLRLARKTKRKLKLIDIDIEDLRPFGLSQHVLNEVAAMQATPGQRLMRVVETQRDAFTLHDGYGEYHARIVPRVLLALQAQGDNLCIGDWVLAQPDDAGDIWIAARVPPLTQIARRANDGRRQPLASNVDTALLTMGLDDDFNMRRMERYIAMVRACGVEAVVVLTKADTCEDAPARAAPLRQRLPSDVAVVVVDGRSPQAGEALAPWLGTGRTLVLLGTSGAGKSTLTNTLAGAALQRTQDVRGSDGRGQHTTTTRSMHQCYEGACIIDTPGLRTWRPDADAAALAATFDDIESLAAHCQFRNCRHEHEPGCAVRALVEADRLLNYHKLLRDAQRTELTPLQRIDQRRKWKKLGKAGSERLRQKHG